MKKKRLNWRKIWRSYDAWFKQEIKRGDCPYWEERRRKLSKIVEEIRNEKPLERKRKTRK